MQRSTKIAVAGATGRVGRPVVDILESRGYDVVPISRSQGVDVITGEGLDEALTGVETIIDVATGPSPDQQAATEFFTTATRNLQEAGERAGVRRLVVVSIIGIDEFEGGYNAAKVAHEQAAFAGPIPARVVRAAQFHEFVEELMRWGTQGDVSYVWNMRTQLVSARTVAEALVDLATAPDPEFDAAETTEVAGPREWRLVEAASLLAAHRGDGLRVEETEQPLRPRQRALRERRRPARTGRHARRPDLRGVAGRDGARRPRLSGAARPREEPHGYLTYDELAGPDLDAARWSPARLPLPTGGEHIPLDPNAEVAVGEGEVRVTIPRFSLSHDAIQSVDSPKYLVFSTRQFELPPDRPATFAVDLAVENIGGDPADYRRAMAAFQVADVEVSKRVFAVCGTSTRVFAMHEHLGLGGGGAGEPFYHVVESPYEDFEDDFTRLRACEITLDRSTSTAAWRVDGHKLYEAHGTLIPERARIGFGIWTKLPIRDGRSRSLDGQGMSARWRRFRVRGVDE